MPNNPEEYIKDKLGFRYYHVVLYTIVDNKAVVYEQVTENESDARQIRLDLEAWRTRQPYNTALFVTVDDNSMADSFSNNEIRGHEIMAHYEELEWFEKFLEEPKHPNKMKPVPKQSFQEAFDEIEELSFYCEESDSWVNNHNSVYALLQELQANYAPEEIEKDK